MRIKASAFPHHSRWALAFSYSLPEGCLREEGKQK